MEEKPNPVLLPPAFFTEVTKVSEVKVNSQEEEEEELQVDLVDVSADSIDSGQVAEVNTRSSHQVEQQIQQMQQIQLEPEKKLTSPKLSHLTSAASAPNFFTTDDDTLTPEGSRSLCPIGVFWDIENCSIPHGKSALKVVQKIRSLPVFQKSSETEFVSVCDVTKLSEEISADLNTAQVSVQHVSGVRKKNAADEKIRNLMRKFIDLHQGRNEVKVTLVLISGDVDFLSDLSDFKRRLGTRIVLLHNRVANRALIEAADEAHDFYEFLSDVPVANSEISSFAFTELEVKNIPSAQEMAKMEIVRVLTELSRPYSGKIKYLNEQDGTAVLKFESGDKAIRAKKNLHGESCGRRRIQVDFNKRVNFMANNRQKRSSSMSPKPVAKEKPVAKIRAEVRSRHRSGSSRRRSPRTPVLVDNDGPVCVDVSSPEGSPERERKIKTELMLRDSTRS